MKRLSIYAIYNANKLSDYVTYYLRCLKSVSQDILVVTKGTFSVESRKTLETLGIDVLEGEKNGLSFSAWKEGLNHKGWETVAAYDELILCNCSSYGPLFPLHDIFARMSQKSCDFWGLDRVPGLKGSNSSYVESNFIVFRKKLTSNKKFHLYWEKLSVQDIRKDEAASEKQLTSFLESEGFVAGTLIAEDSNALVDNYSVKLPQFLLSHGTPLINRNIFFIDYGQLIYCSKGSQAIDILHYVTEHTDYPVDLIMKDMLENLQGSKIRNLLHNTYVLPDDSACPEETKEKVALVIFSYYDDLIDESIHYINSMPMTSAVYIVVVSNEMRLLWEKNKNNFSGKKIEIRIQQNRGRNENAYWLTCRDVVEKYDIICVAHDKKTPCARPPLIGYYFGKHCWDNILKTPEYVSNVINLFRTHERLGILMPPTLLFGGYDSCILNMEWAGNKAKAKSLYKRLNMHVPFDDAPDAPWGAMFWFRAKAMAPLYRYAWKTDDFPEEPIKVQDGTILHAMERFYPMIVQEAGYFSAWIMPESEARIHFDNMYYLLRKKDSQLKSIQSGQSDMQDSEIEEVTWSGVRHILKLYLKKIIKNFFNKA